ncbi:hypothetical protein [Rummeliibacillus sp. TYF-LIM-RU47]|uniref:hypothetical protein n=1 Tax=Rummeliibacillus sp. TYF-LIM-RU47 TaxID=2608406 RepID=UPI00123B5EDE|nr:hypothetical protein [Rummeliibacillus sp. TYF-LIM-RU47]
MSRAVKAVGGLTVAIGGAIGGAKLLDATLGEAMRYEQSEVLVSAMLDDRKLSKQYTAMVQRLAEKSPLMDTSTMMDSSKAFIGITKSMPSLEKAWGIAEKLSIMDPEQGLQGAVYAMKELASGDGVSMAERFEMPKSVVNSIKNLSFEEQLKAMDEYLAKTGITTKTVEKMGGTTVAKWNQVKEKLQSTFRTMGKSGNSQIGKALDGVLAGLDKGAFNRIAKKVDAGLGNAIEKVANYVKKVDFKDLGEKATAAFDKMTKGAKWVSDNWSTITKVVKGVAIAFIALKSLSFLVGTFTTISKAVSIGIKVFKTVTKVIGFARKAFTLIRLAMLLFPGSWIVAAIGAVIAIAITLYKHWDTVKAKTKRLWDALGGIKGVVRVMTGPLGIIIGAAVDLAKNWDKTKGVWENVWGAIKRSAAESVNSVIGGINEMIKTINKLPGVNIPVVAKVDWGNSKATMPAKVLDKKVPKLGNLVNYAPKTATHPTNAIAGAAKPTPALDLANYSSLPGHKGGLARVGHDNYIARLHEGERVLTKEQNKEYSNGTNGVNVSFEGAIFNVRQESDIRKIAKDLATLIVRSKNAGN